MTTAIPTPRLYPMHRLVGALVLAATTVLGGCQSGPAHEYETDGPQPRAAPGGTVAALAADPEFAAFLDLGVEMSVERYVAQRDLTDEDLQAIVVTINHPGYLETTDVPTLLTNLGVDPQLLSAQRDLAARLIQRHGLSDSSPEVVSQAFSEAAKTDGNRSYLEGAIENELHDIEGDLDTSIDDCEATCIAAYAAAAASALVSYGIALGGGVAAGPAWFAVVGPATVAYISALATAQNALDRCMDECDGVIDSGEECDADSDCASDEFCWKGVVGIGANECRPLKDETDTCSRHGQCESGCCKLHVWTHPVSKTCRPEDKC